MNRTNTAFLTATLGSAVAAAIACGSTDSSSPPPSGDGGSSNDGGGGVVVIENEGGAFNGWPAAAPLGDVQVVANRDSAVLKIPRIAGAQDYRVFAIGPDVKVTPNADGTEGVQGATIFCAGREQHSADVKLEPNALLQVVEVLGLKGTTKFAVEAIDHECPFPGLLAPDHLDLVVEQEIIDFGFDKTYPAFTEAEIRAKHGSLIINGQGPAAVGARAADPNNPRVLARAQVDVTPTGIASKPTAFFDDFDDDNDQFKYISTYGPTRNNNTGHLLGNSKWNMYVFDSDDGWVSDEQKKQSMALIHRGQLTTYIAQQESFGTAMLVPKKPVKVSDTSYLHLTFEVSTNSTDRRYWWFSLCGASTAGNTYDPSGTFLGRMQLTPFFYDGDGENPYVNGWNCLQVFSFEGGYDDLGPTNTKPESSVRVLINRPTEGDPTNKNNSVNVSAQQYGADTSVNCSGCGWYRTWDAKHALTGVMFDDVLGTAPRVKFDMYIRRDRVVLYANNQQKLCNDFPKAKLTMAEGAIGLGHLLYHSVAEHLEFTRDDWIRTSQRALLTLTPWVDQRNWDNVGYEEDVQNLPAGFDPATCWVSDKQ